MRCLCSFDTGFHCMILASLELRDTLASPLNVPTDTPKNVCYYAQ